MQLKLRQVNVTNVAAASCIGTSTRLQQTCQVIAIDVLHRNSILHLDLSPERWVRTPDGRLRLLDPGIASLLLPKHWDDLPSSAGMPPVLAPEMRGNMEAASEAADVFALGHVFRFLRTGEFPFKSMKFSDLPRTRLQWPETKFGVDVEASCAPAGTLPPTAGYQTSEA